MPDVMRISRAESSFIVPFSGERVNPAAAHERKGRAMKYFSGAERKRDRINGRRRQTLKKTLRKS
jgi:hypothetical protein